MKKFLIITLIAAAALVSLAACGNRNNNTNGNDGTNSTNPANSTNPLQEMVTNAVDDVSRAVGDVLDGTDNNRSADSSTDDWRGLGEMMSDASYSAPNGNNR